MDIQRIKHFVLGEPSGEVPDRVRDVIERQQANSEILIAWFQLVVVVTFGILYAVSPKTHMYEPWETPVFFVLLFYFLFTVLRLLLAHGGQLKGWILYPAVVLDVFVVVMLIWSFHWQYEQPAAFSLKAPTLLYVFIFIALRALRFEPRYVLLCGFAAAVCWVGLVGYAVGADPDDMMTTRDYVTYLTSNSILVGAEFDKVISICIVTLIIAVALVRARRLLERSVAEQSAAQELSRFFSPEIAEQITNSENRITAGQGEERVCAVLTVDLRLNGNVERCGGFVCDKECGLADQRHSNHCSLPEATGEFERVSLDCSSGIGKADTPQHIAGAACGFLARTILM